jgi:DNA-binding transcriptional MocR family regulator
MLGGWAESHHGTLAQRLAHALRRAIAAGLLADGARLPAERSLAESLAVSRSTITAALQQLRDDAAVESRQGSGWVVRGAGGQPMVTNSRIAEHFAERPGIDLAAGNPTDPSHWPRVKVDVADLVSDGGGPGVQPLGLASLRQALADRETKRGRLTDVAQIHVTSGAHQGIALLVGSCCQPGDAVAVEETSYPGIFDVVENLGCRAVAIATDRAGMVPEALDRALTEARPPALYIQAGPHNPTGRAPAPGRLRALAAILDRHDTLVIEDCALADLTFAGRVDVELAELCRHAVVASIGSFSKVAWGGLRIGWVRAPAPLIERTRHLRLATDLGPSVPSQLLVLQLLPHIEQMARTRRATLGDSVRRAAEVLRAEIPAWEFTEPEGGSVLWVALPVADSGPFVRLARNHGVLVAPGSAARAGRFPDPHIRICVDRPWELVANGLQRLELAWRETQREARRHREPVLG